eukprot:1335782-Prymnesium_polylepis.1
MVRVCRGNIQVNEATAHEVAAELLLIAARDEDIAILSKVHGAHATRLLTDALVSIPNREWTVADDVWLIAETWRQPPSSIPEFMKPNPHVAHRHGKLNGHSPASTVQTQ